MERPRHRVVRPLICATVVVLLLGLIAFSCCIAAEFKKVKDKDIKLDGSLCSMPRRPAFGLGIAAIVCLFISQTVGTSSTASKVCIRWNSKRHHAVSITLLVLSWISFVLAAVLLATASSMNNLQRYGRGWMNGECFVVKDGIFVGAAILAAANIIFTIGFTLTTREMTPRQTRPDEERIDSQQHKQAGPPSTDAGSSCMEWKGQNQGCRGPT